MKVWKSEEWIRRYLRDFIFTRYFTPRKFLNLFRMYYEYRERKDVVKAYPCKLQIDICNLCNLKCPLCPTGTGKRGRTKWTMRLSDFKRLVDEVKPCIYEIGLFNWGEPMLNKDMFDIIDYAHKANIRTRISTNLNHFKPEFAKRFVDSGLDYLIVSLDGASQKTYSAYRRGGDFNKVIENVRKIAEEKRRRGKKRPYLIWQFIVMKQNEHELRKAVQIAQRIGIDIMKIEAVRSDMGQEIFESDREKIKNSAQWLPKNEKLSRFDYMKESRKMRKKGCIFLWSTMVINPDGSASPCCAVYPEKYDFGNAFRDGLMKIWNNEKYVASRRIVSGKKSGISTVCANCLKNGFIE